MEHVIIPTTQPSWPSAPPAFAAAAATFLAASAAAPAEPPGAPLFTVTNITPSARTGMEAHCGRRGGPGLGSLRLGAQLRAARSCTARPFIIGSSKAPATERATQVGRAPPRQGVLIQ